MDFTSPTTESEQWLQKSTGTSLPLGDGGMSGYASDSSMVWANEADASSASASVTSRDHRILSNSRMSPQERRLTQWRYSRIGLADRALNQDGGEQLHSNVQSGSYSPFRNSQMGTRPFLSTTPLEPIETSGHDMQSEDTDFLSPVSAENEDVSTGHVAPKTDAEIRAEKRKMKRFREYIFQPWELLFNVRLYFNIRNDLSDFTVVGQIPLLHPTNLSRYQSTYATELHPTESCLPSSAIPYDHVSPWG
ncbi:MAG: hypothetical protein Q9206_001909 [Seirophora lacunosa]